ncbi:toll/interleukin-1 receptor domain-containing protein [Kitasatospora cheerisanensis]|uniref:toll/interleukin-1 receptor domain-containing protein n=1 Tax=Kitasatospora cheerisanensis TaxID=81942 RepID=UPI001FCC9B59|nr:TIR domain-containing protein [Kitasatospora cheerisanensis]
MFVNYRTGDGDAVAALLEHELSGRFGTDQVFRASKSIAPGSRFPQQLITAVRRCHVLLAVIGRHWFEPRKPGEQPAIEDPADWTRREIIEAFESGAVVIPILADSPRFDASQLPTELAELADCHYRRLDMRNSYADLARIGDDLAELVPALAKLDSRRKEPEGRPAKDGRERVGRLRMRDGVGAVGGDLSGTVINSPRGPIHTGSGNLNSGPQFSGDGMGVQYLDGGDVRDSRQQFGGVSGREGGRDR